MNITLYMYCTLLKHLKAFISNNLLRTFHLKCGISRGKADTDSMDIFVVQYMSTLKLYYNCTNIQTLKIPIPPTCLMCSHNDSYTEHMLTVKNVTQP